MENIIDYYEAHPEEAEKIIENAHQFVDNHALQEGIYAYIVLILNKYALLLNNEVQIQPNMVKFTHNIINKH